MQGSREVDPSAVQRYVVRHSAQQLGAPQAVWEHPLWAGAEIATIAHWEWPDPNGPENGPQGLHRPHTRVKVLYDSDYLALLWCVDDAYVRAQYTTFQDGTCRDSCCEFFVAPHADSHDSTPFFNFETNAGGTMLLYNCTRTDARGNVPLSEEDGATILMKSSLRPDPGTDAPWGAGRRIEPELTGPTTWCIEYHVRSLARTASLPSCLCRCLYLCLCLRICHSVAVLHNYAFLRADTVASLHKTLRRCDASKPRDRLALQLLQVCRSDVAPTLCATHTCCLLSQLAMQF